ncbi:MAG: HAD family hydrolase [Proteobacteria bacterium]|nr:HAD family hydrolase [Pseudomonadota bacterium]
MSKPSATPKSNAVKITLANAHKHLPRPTAILFDWDNTLADTWQIIFESLHDTFIAMGHEPWSMEDVRGGREGIHHSLRDSFPRIFGDKWNDAREVYYKSFLKHHLDKIAGLPDVPSVLRLLSESDIYVGIVSNKTGEYLRQEVTHLGWDSYFRKIVGATDAKRDKPFPDPVHLAMEGSNIDIGKHVWLIGDSITDIECAVNAGCTPILFGENVVRVGDKHMNWPVDFDHLVHVKDHKQLETLMRKVLS